MQVTKKGFTFVEVLMGGILVSLAACGVAGAVALQKGVEIRAYHKLQAITAAQAAADQINDIGERILGDTEPYNVPSALSLGTHTEVTNPIICVLPDDFKKAYNASITYVVDSVNVLTKTKLTRVTIMVTWNEGGMPNSKRTEELITFPYAL